MARTAVAVGLLVLGLGLLAGSGYVWAERDLAHYGQGTYAITAPEGTALEPAPTAPDDAPVVAYADLPPDAQRAFDAARSGDGVVLWSRDDRRAVEAILPYSGGYVEYRGDYYRMLVLSGHRGQGYWWQSLVAFLASGGLGLAAVGIGAKRLLGR